MVNKIRDRAKLNRVTFEAATGSILEDLKINENTATQAEKDAGQDSNQSKFWSIVAMVLGPAIAKANEVLGVNVGRPKKCKNTEVSKIVEISEWSKNRKPCRSKHHYHLAGLQKELGCR